MVEVPVTTAADLRATGDLTGVALRSDRTRVLAT